jgi:ribosomal protein L11 methyltransferase
MTDTTYQIILTTSGSEALESLKLKLEAQGFADFIESTYEKSPETSNWELSFYRPSEQEAKDLKKTLEQKFSALTTSIRVTSFSSALWNEAWEDKFSHLETEKFKFVPPGFEVPKTENKKPIFIDPGAFGTGEHATTKASLKVLEKLEKTINSKDGFLDIGTGTGIFAAWAEAEGFSDVIGTDIIEEAIASAEKTRALNNQNFEVLFQSFPEEIKKYSVIACNILPPELFNVFAEIKKRMGSESILVIAGFNEANEDMAIEACKNHGFQIVMAEKERGWISYGIKKFKL